MITIIPSSLNNMTAFAHQSRMCQAEMFRLSLHMCQHLIDEKAVYTSPRCVFWLAQCVWPLDLALHVPWGDVQTWPNKSCLSCYSKRVVRGNRFLLGWWAMVSFLKISVYLSGDSTECPDDDLWLFFFLSIFLKFFNLIINNLLDPLGTVRPKSPKQTGVKVREHPEL